MRRAVGVPASGQACGAQGRPGPVSQEGRQSRGLGSGGPSAGPATARRRHSSGRGPSREGGSRRPSPAAPDFGPEPGRQQGGRVGPPGGPAEGAKGGVWNPLRAQGGLHTPAGRPHQSPRWATALLGLSSRGWLLSPQGRGAQQVLP